MKKVFRINVAGNDKRRGLSGIRATLTKDVILLSQMSLDGAPAAKNKNK